MTAKQRNRSIHFTIDATGFQALQALTSDKAPESTETILCIDTNAFDLLRRGVVITLQPDGEQFGVTAQRRPLPNPLEPEAYSPLSFPVHTKERAIKRALDPNRWAREVRELLPQLPAADAVVVYDSAVGAGDATAAGGARIGIQPTMSMAEACRLLLCQQLLEMIGQEAGVRYSTEIEYVHQMRVAIRRLRAAAKLFGESMKRKQLRPYLKQVRKTGTLLGAVRDLDVAIDKAQKRKRTRNQKQIEQWRRERLTAHAELVQWLDTEEYQQFLTNFLTFCAAAEQRNQPVKAQPKRKGKRNPVPVTEQPAEVKPQEVRHVVPRLLMERFAAVRCYETVLAQDAPIPYETLHELRIECKYLRYSLEFTQHLLGEKSKGVMKQLKQLQELLGDLNDAVVALQMVDAQPAKRTTAKQEQYRQHQIEVIAQLRAKVPAQLAQLVGPENRRKLGVAIANL